MHPSSPSRLPLVALVGALLALPATAAADGWLPPVAGEMVRPFDYTRAAPFTPGAHRGVDLAARPGAAVRSACAGTVVHAGSVAGGAPVVSVGCGGRRVSYGPLASVAIRVGAHIRPGAPIGTLAPGHGGLHLGVRRARDPFGYEDPVALLGRPGSPFAPAPRAARPRRPARRAARPVPPRPAPPPPAPAPRPATPGSAPWPVWAGLAMLLSGAAGSGTLVVRRRRHRRFAHRSATVGGPVP
jgi:murein DD-endopeptidase MepM/ murein hydrolase activator NlpD